MNQQVIFDFFDFAKPCPETIPFCHKLREKYQDEIDRLTKTGCSACKKNSVKSEYIKKVWESHILSTINKP